MSENHKSETYRHTLEEVKLVYSKAVAKGRTSKKILEIYSEKKKKSSVISGEILQKSIHSYRLWFRFLKLALELEQQGTVLIMREEKKVNGVVRKRITQKVKVNHSKYEGWDLDEVLESTFDDWWKSHRYLFVDEITKVLDASSDSISEDSNHLTIQIDTRRRLVDVIQDIRDLNAKKKIFNVKNKREKFSINGRVRPLVLQNRYNALVLKLENELSNEEILKHQKQYIRATDARNKDGYQTQKTSDERYSQENLHNREIPNYGATIHDLLSGNSKSYGAKQILMSVCDGYFMKNENKTYLEE